MILNDKLWCQFLVIKEYGKIYKKQHFHTK